MSNLLKPNFKTKAYAMLWAHLVVSKDFIRLTWSTKPIPISILDLYLKHVKNIELILRS